MDTQQLKCYMADTGLLISLAFDEKTIVAEEIYKKLLLDKLEINKGMLVENIVAQMLRASGHRLYFYSQYSNVADDRMEIDFLIQKPTISNRHNISPIEVKSSTRYTLTSLGKFMKKYNTQLYQPYVIHYQDLKNEGGIVFLPIYMTIFL
jgi:predicted AAA+ superfamily ATPase